MLYLQFIVVYMHLLNMIMVQAPGKEEEDALFLLLLLFSLPGKPQECLPGSWWAQAIGNGESGLESSLPGDHFKISKCPGP